MKYLKKILFSLTIVISWINCSNSLTIESFTATTVVPLYRTVILNWEVENEPPNTQYKIYRKPSSSPPASYSLIRTIQGAALPYYSTYNDPPSGTYNYQLRVFVNGVQVGSSYTTAAVPVSGTLEVPKFSCRAIIISQVDTFYEDNELFFDIMMQHTNSSASPNFLYSFGEYSFNFNPNIANGGNLTYTIVSSDLPLNARPKNPQIFDNQLRLTRNDSIAAGSAPIIASTGNGTKIARMKLETTASSFAHQYLNLSWRNINSGDPYTKVGLFLNSTRYDITDLGTYSVEGNDPLPVELSNFTANIYKNNVFLKWSTSMESNNSGFDVERMNSKSQNLSEWTKRGFVEGNGNTNEQIDYSFTDKLGKGKYKYRLKQIDYNGNFKFYYLQNEVEVGIPTSVNLSQNYPNPFNPETKIDFELPYDGIVSLTLYDIMGREVSKLLNESKQAGYYTVQLKGNNLSSGTYYYRLTVKSEYGNIVLTKKLVLLK